MEESKIVSLIRKAGFELYDLVEQYPFADIYELKEEYIGQLNTEPIQQK